MTSRSRAAAANANASASAPRGPGGGGGGGVLATGGALLDAHSAREKRTDSLNQGVFILRRAPAQPKRFIARKSFKPLVPDETVEGLEARWDAYERSWASTDAHVSRVLADANRGAFEKLEAFVRGDFAERVALRDANGGALPQSVAQRVPVGLVLAGGVNSDDHEETFTKLTRHLRAAGCHAALLRSRDLKARAASGGGSGGGGGSVGGGAVGATTIAGGGGGGGGGGLGVATRCILTQLQAATRGGGTAGNLRISGRSVRHLKRWYQDVTIEEFNDAPRGGGGLGGDRDGDRGGDRGGNENVNVNGDGDGDATAERSYALRARPADAAIPSDPALAAARVIRGPPKPIVVVIEDTEGFDGRVLSDLLLALSDGGDALPVHVLLGVATSAATMHGMIPAAVAAKLAVRSFHLWSPKSIMAAVQERVLLDPARAPALSATALGTLMSRFQEHDYSLSAARRAMHLLTLDHFMHRPLSALATVVIDAGDAADAANEETAGAGAGAGAGDGFLPGDVDVGADVDVAAIASRAAIAAAAASSAAETSARELARRHLTPKSIQWARKFFSLDDASSDAAAEREILDALIETYPARRRWATALRCVAAASRFTGLRGEARSFANLLADASRPRWLTGDGGTGDYPQSGGGASLLRLACSRLESEDVTPRERFVGMMRTWAAICAGDPEMHAREGPILAELIRLSEEDPAAAVENARDADAAAAVDARATSPPSAGREKRRRSGGSGVGIASPENAAAVQAALIARRSAGPERAKNPEPHAARRKTRGGADASTGAEEEKENAARDALALAPDVPRREGGGDRTGGDGGVGHADAPRASPRARASLFLRRVARRHASKPPASLPCADIFCVNSSAAITVLREGVQCAPRLCMEQTMSAPRDVLKCACCPGRSEPPTAALPDACAAYVLLQDSGDAANVHELFRSFCELHEPYRAGGGGEDEVEVDVDVADGEKKGTFHLSRPRLWELQARFTRAVAELEFLGVARPVKKRKVEYMQRTAFPLDKLLGGDD